MRCMLLPLIYGSEKQTGIIDAFKELGHEVEIFDYFSYYENHRSNQRITRQAFIEAAKRFNPDLIFLQIQHTVIIDQGTIQVIRSFLPNVKVINYTVDVRSYIPGPYFSISKVSDLNLICSTGQLEMYQSNGTPNVNFLHVGYSPKLYQSESEPKESYEFDAVFIANVNNVENYPGHEERLNIVKALRSSFGQKFGLFGHGWSKENQSLGSIPIDEVGKNYARSFCNISVSHFNNITHYFSDRLLHCLAIGRPVISYYFPGYDSYFVDGQDLLIAHSPEEVVEKVKWCLNNKDKANIIGQNGAAKVFAEHTYLSRITEMLDMIGLK